MRATLVREGVFRDLVTTRAGGESMETALLVEVVRSRIKKGSAPAAPVVPDKPPTMRERRLRALSRPPVKSRTVVPDRPSTDQVVA
jgi:hypothetical protein